MSQCAPCPALPIWRAASRVKPKRCAVITVCRHYLPQGYRAGRYWVTGDVMGTPGRSLYVRLHGPDYGSGAAGKWTDAATGEHGDLLDLIAGNHDLASVADAMDEARRFLSLPRASSVQQRHMVPRSSPDAAPRLFNAGTPIVGTLAERYLRGRGLIGALDCSSLRFHPSVYYRATPVAPRETWPALLGAVTDLDGNITGVQRTYLNPVTADKAPLVEPRRALGHLLGNGVRFGKADSVMIAGEGIETMLSLQSAMPSMPIIAALSANHLAALKLPASLHRLYIAQDNDDAGRRAVSRLRLRATAQIDVRELRAVHDDFNLDLRHLGSSGLSAHVAGQLAPDDRERVALPDRF